MAERAKVDYADLLGLAGEAVRLAPDAGRIKAVQPNGCCEPQAMGNRRRRTSRSAAACTEPASDSKMSKGRQPTVVVDGASTISRWGWSGGRNGGEEEEEERLRWLAGDDNGVKLHTLGPCMCDE